MISSTDSLFEGVHFTRKYFKTLILFIHNPLCFCVNQFVKKQSIFHHDLVIIRVLEAKCSHQTINHFYGTFYPTKAETCNTINHCSC